MSVVAAVLAAGSGRRFGADKTSLILGGKPVWRWSIEVLKGIPEVSRVLLVTAPERVESLRALADGFTVISGGVTRQASARAALEAAADAEVLLVHDAARPFLSERLVRNVLAEVARSGAAAAACAVTDTVKRVREGRIETLPREELVAMQTPQAAKVDLLREAHAQAQGDYTDDMALLESIGVQPVLVPGEPGNFKITTPEDFLRAQGALGMSETRSGFGYDIHPFSEDAERALWLGGVHFPGHPGLEGHSDADVLLHAVTDSLLGAAALGDIGQHFPNTDPQWRGKASSHFLRHAATLLQAEGWSVVNIDATVVAESPKVMKRASEIRMAIADAVGCDAARVSVKATTNERLGSIGRSEGIAAFATATIRR